MALLSNRVRRAAAVRVGIALTMAALLGSASLARAGATPRVQLSVEPSAGARGLP